MLMAKKIINIQIQKYLELSSKETTYWQVYTTNLQGMQIYVGFINTLPQTKYADIIEQAEKTFKKEIKVINNSK